MLTWRGFAETVTFVMGAYSLVLGVPVAHNSVLVGDDTHDSTLEGTGLYTTV